MMGLPVGATSPDTELTPEQMRRYSRQMIIDDIGEAGQKRLLNARVAVIGAGGLGCPVLGCLIGAGIGSLFVCDPDRVGLSNLHRQTLYNIDDLGRSKADCVADFAEALNPDVDVIVCKDLFSPALLPDGVDLLIDTTDQHDCRLDSARFCRHNHIAYLTAAVQGYSGLLFQQNPETTAEQETIRKTPPASGGKPALACYGCVFPRPPDPALVSNCEQVGILGSMTTTLGGLLAQRALQFLLHRRLEPALFLCDFVETSLYPISLAGTRCSCPESKTHGDDRPETAGK